MNLTAVSAAGPFNSAAGPFPPAATSLHPGLLARPRPDPTSLAGLPACVEDAQLAALAGGDGPADPRTFSTLRARLVKAEASLPEAYRKAAFEPLLRRLDQLGAAGFARLLAEDPAREAEAGLLLDVAQAILQQGEGYQARATAAFQEVVSDLYEGFLAAEGRQGVKPPEGGILPPLVRWGSAGAGPYTWPVTATASLGVGVAVVSLPAANATAGLLAWPALAHEVAGHDLMAADHGLGEELAKVVRTRLLADKSAPVVADYWADRIEESAADVLGVLNMGPAAAEGLIGYFRGLNGAWGEGPALRTDGPVGDDHPADLARAYLAAETVRLLSFKGASRWADKLIAEADRDLGRIHLGDTAVTAGVAKASAAAVARAIATTPLASLEGRTLLQIQDWRDSDEAIVAELRRSLRGGAGGGEAGRDAAAGAYAAGAYAAHAVAAGVQEAVSGEADPVRVMGRMVAMLAAMHDRNPAWGRQSISPRAA